MVKVCFLRLTFAIHPRRIDVRQRGLVDDLFRWLGRLLVYYHAAGAAPAALLALLHLVPVCWTGPSSGGESEGAGEEDGRQVGGGFGELGGSGKKGLETWTGGFGLAR